MVAGTTAVVLVRSPAPADRPARVAQARPLPIAAPANAAADQTANLTLDDIAAAVEARGPASTTSRSTSRTTPSAADPTNLFYRSEMSVQLKGGKVAYRHIYSAAPETGGNLFIRQIAFNGRHTMTYGRPPGAAVSPGPTRETSLKGMGFFDLMLWNRPEGAEGAGDMGPRGDAAVAPGQPAVGDGGGSRTPCRVVDVKWPRSEKTLVTLWLDPARGFLPLRHVWFNGPDFEKVLMEFDVEEAVEIPPGVWCTTVGRKLLHPDGSKFIKQECEWRMVVDRGPDRQPKIRLNGGIDDGVFEPWRTLPPGTWLIDDRTRKAVAVDGADYDAFVAGLALSPAIADGSTANSGQPGRHARTAAPRIRAGPQGPPVGLVLGGDRRGRRSLGSFGVSTVATTDSRT